MFIKTPHVAIRIIYASIAISSSSQAYCAIIPRPDGLVDAGSYITDTLTGLDWYKFSNTKSTIGLSFSDVTNSASDFTAMGWRAATVDQVGTLWRRFGYALDTDATPGTNQNAGLTDAVASLFGYTFQRDFPTGFFIRNVVGLAGGVGAPSGIYQSTLFISHSVRDYAGLANDHVPSPTYSWNGAGTYLVRDSTPTFVVSEGSHFSLACAVAVALAATGFKRKRPFTQDSR